MGVCKMAGVVSDIKCPCNGSVTASALNDWRRISEMRLPRAVIAGSCHITGPLSDASGYRGWVLFSQNVPYCDGGPLFDVIETYADDQAADQYLNENWPELR